MISEQNLEHIKEIIYMNCKAKNTLRIGGLMTLYKLIDTIIMDSSTSKFRIYEACKWLNARCYIEFRSKNPKSSFFGYVHFVTPKLWVEMEKKVETETKEVQQKFSGDLVYA